jgi:hypothetical protein
VAKRSVVTILAGFAVLISLASACAPRKAADRFTILHTNDVRGYTDPCG